MNRLIQICMLVLLAVSCSTGNNPEITYQWPRTDSIKSDVLHADTSLIGAYDPCKIGDYMLIQDLLQKKSKIYNCYQIVGDSLKWVNAFLGVGKGPKEAFRASMAFMPDKQQAYIFTSLQHVMVMHGYEIDVSGGIDALFNPDNYNHISTPEKNIIDRVCPIDSVSFLVTNGDNGNALISYFNTHDSTIIDLPLPYPQDGVEAPYDLKSMIYMGRIMKHPSEPKFVYSSSYGHYVVSFDIKDGKLHNLKTLFNTYPTYQPRKDGQGVQSLHDCLLGLKPSLTSQYIYLLKNDIDSVNGREIMIFDWTGHPVRILALDTAVAAIFVDENDKYIYAFARAEGDTEEQMLRFEL